MCSGCSILFGIISSPDDLSDKQAGATQTREASAEHLHLPLLWWGTLINTGDQLSRWRERTSCCHAVFLTWIDTRTKKKRKKRSVETLKQQMNTTCLTMTLETFDKSHSSLAPLIRRSPPKHNYVTVGKQRFSLSATRWFHWGRMQVSVCLLLRASIIMESLMMIKHLLRK